MTVQHAARDVLPCRAGVVGVVAGLDGQLAAGRECPLNIDHCLRGHGVSGQHVGRKLDGRDALCEGDRAGGHGALRVCGGDDEGVGPIEDLLPLGGREGQRHGGAERRIEALEGGAVKLDHDGHGVAVLVVHDVGGGRRRRAEAAEIPVAAGDRRLVVVDDRAGRARVVSAFCAGRVVGLYAVGHGGLAEGDGLGERPGRSVVNLHP